MFLLLAPSPIGAQKINAVELITNTTETAKAQLTAIAKTFAVLQEQKVESLQQLAQQGKKDPAKTRVVQNIITSPETGSMQMTYAGGTVKIIENTLSSMTGKTGEKELAARAKSVKNKALKEYYKKTAPAYLKSNKAISDLATNIFKAKNQKQIQAAVKTHIKQAVTALATIKDKITPESAKQFAEQLGSIKGVLEASGQKSAVDAKTIAKLEEMITQTNEFDTAVGVSEATVKKFTSLITPASRQPQPNLDNANLNQPAMAA